MNTETIIQGQIKGEQCNRNGCSGVIDEHEKEGSCCCHINPPCNYCTTDAAYCPICGWEGQADQKNYSLSEADADYYKREQEKWEQEKQAWLKKLNGETPVTEIDYRIKSHTHFSQICEGVYPTNEPDDIMREEVLGKVKGTFGGRFTRFGNGRFEYIAYTD